MRELIGNNYSYDYPGADENVYIDRCIEIVKRALDSGVEHVTE